MEIQGLTPVDTLYEFAGYAIGHRLAEYALWTWYLPTLLIAGALLRLFYLGYRRDSYADLAVYPLYVLFIAFLVWPIEATLTAQGESGPTVLDQTFTSSAGRRNVEGRATDENPLAVRIPRILAVVHALTESLVRHVVYDMEPSFRSAAFAWQRVAAVNEQARIYDPELRLVFDHYLKFCYWPVMSAGRSAGWKNSPFFEEPETLAALGDTWAPNIRVGYSQPAEIPCHDLRSHLVTAMRNHVKSEPLHRTALEAFAAASRFQADPRTGSDSFEEHYLRRIAYNETFVISDRNEVAFVRRALPEYSLTDQNYWSTGNTSGVTGLISRAASAIIAGVSSISEWWNQEALGPTTYYRVTALGPYVYGLTTAILLMGFPVAGLASFWPGAWTAIVNFLKVFLSVKLWPVFWSFLSRMNVERGRFDPSDENGFEGTFGQSEVFAALAGMYLLVPGLSYLLVAIVSRTSTVTMGALIGPGATGSLQGTVQAGAAAGRAVGSLVQAGAAGA